MTDLQKLAINHIEKLSKEVDSECISLAGKLMREEKENIDAQEQIYPIAEKARTITFWTSAIIKETE